MSDPSKNHAGLSCRHVLTGGPGLTAPPTMVTGAFGSISCAVAGRLAGGFAVTVNHAGHAKDHRGNRRGDQQ